MPQYHSYISQDFVIQGSLVELDPEKSWLKIEKRARNAIRKARFFNPKIIKVSGTEEDIEKFRPFCPNRDDLPASLRPGQHMYFAYLGDELVGGIVVTELADRLYLHFHAATEFGKQHKIPSLLLWHVVEEFKNSPFQYLDIGASYRPSLQDYFTSFATKTYPVVMRPPEYKPQILINPFAGEFLYSKATEKDVQDGRKALAEFLRTEEFTIFPRGMYAIFALFKWMALEGKIKPDDEVCIRTTTESPYISSCVTSAIEETCRWGREINESTKAIFVIHEFGFPHPQVAELKKKAVQLKVPLVEDCAYSLGSGDSGQYGDFVIYSLSKTFPVQFGGVLVGRKFDYDYIWQNFGCADKNKEEVSLAAPAKYLPEFGKIKEARRRNYEYYGDVFGKEKAFFGEQFSESVSPGVFMLKMADEEEMQETSEFVRQFGVECGNYWKNSAIFLPAHQNLTEPQLEYIAGAVFGAKSYHRIAPKYK